MPVDVSGGDPDLYIYTMGNITLKSPIYDYCGVYDPSIWYWMEKHGTSNIGMTSNGQPELEIKSENGQLSVSSWKSPIVRLLLVQPDGMLLKSIHTKQETVQLPLSDYAGKVLILEIVLANGEKVVKKIVYRQKL